VSAAMPGDPIAPGIPGGSTGAELHQEQT